MPNTTTTLRDVASGDEFLTVAAIEMVSLFEHFEFELLVEYDVFAPLRGDGHEFTWVVKSDSGHSRFC